MRPPLLDVGPRLPGWRVLHPQAEVLDGPEIRLVVRDAGVWRPLAETMAEVSDFVLRARVRFQDGAAGVDVRWSEAGDYAVRLDASGAVRLAARRGNQPWDDGLHPTGSGERELEVRMRGDLLEVLVDGAPAGSLRDGSLPAGTVRLLARCGPEGPARVAFANLEVEAR